MVDFGKVVSVTEQEIEQMQAGYELDELVTKNVIGEDVPPRGYSVTPYSTDLAEAFQVIEKLRSMGAWISISIQSNYKTWDVRGILNERKDNEKRFINHDESLPVAICRAALLAFV